LKGGERPWAMAVVAERACVKRADAPSSTGRFADIFTAAFKLASSYPQHLTEKIGKVLFLRMHLKH
jgi:hypothetical protein